MKKKKISFNKSHEVGAEQRKRHRYYDYFRACVRLFFSFLPFFLVTSSSSIPYTTAQYSQLSVNG